MHTFNQITGCYSWRKLTGQPVGQCRRCLGQPGVLAQGYGQLDVDAPIEELEREHADRLVLLGVPFDGVDGLDDQSHTQAITPCRLGRARLRRAHPDGRHLYRGGIAVAVHLDVVLDMGGHGQGARAEAIVDVARTGGPALKRATDELGRTIDVGPCTAGLVTLGHHPIGSEYRAHLVNDALGTGIVDAPGEVLTRGRARGHVAVWGDQGPCSASPGSRGHDTGAEAELSLVTHRDGLGGIRRHPGQGGDPQQGGGQSENGTTNEQTTRHAPTSFLEN